ncbi:6-pyruvoyl tetrahydropterin synthase/QueD family protein [Phytophthora cactorum]|nr:6-pyruvoyl tetrahydropterin synthase/QueD family protein [Phytophthora cactorum]
MGKELTIDHVKRHGVSDGVAKCCYFDKENTSHNVDNCATHLRGCVKTRESVKSQNLPRNGAGTATIKQSAMDAPMAAAIAVSLPNSKTKVVKVHVSKDYMKFNAAHFIAYKGFREKLHGHNYRLAVTITGQVGSDGYVVDFGEIKRISRVICKDLNESFLVPMKSDALKISCDGANIHIITEDMATFRYLKECGIFRFEISNLVDLLFLCILVSLRLTVRCCQLYTRRQRSLPFTFNQFVDAFTLDALLERGVQKLEVSISEAEQQFASYELVLIAETT